MPVLSRKRTASAARQAGFTLIEMMISITIGLGILAGLVGVLATNSSNSRSNDRTSELMTNGRYALNAMKREVREAGFRAYTWAEPMAPGALGALTNECLEAGAPAGSFVPNIRQGVWGLDNAPASDPFITSCVQPPNLVAAGNDVLVVRRLAPVATPTASLAANTVYFESSYAVGQIFRATTAPVTPPAFTGSPTPLASFAVQVYVYYISPSTAAENPPVPALYRVALLPDGSMARELVASGIERMQVQYGKFTTDLNAQYLDASALVGSSSATLATDWDNVHSVRIWLLARNSTPEPGYRNTTPYAMGGGANDFTAPGDAFRRQLFTTVVQLRNKE